MTLDPVKQFVNPATGVLEQLMPKGLPLLAPQAQRRLAETTRPRAARASILNRRSA
jgi:hypothetical protein